MFDKTYNSSFYLNLSSVKNVLCNNWGPRSHKENLYKKLVRLLNIWNHADNSTDFLFFKNSRKQSSYKITLKHYLYSHIHIIYDIRTILS